MKKYFTLLLALFGTGILYAQNRTTSVGFTFSGDLTKSLRTGNDAYGIYQKISDQIHGEFGLTTGFSFSFQKHEKRAFDIGLLYMRHHESLIGGYISTWYSYYFKDDLYTHIASVPINWVFYFSTSRTKLFTTLGVAPSYILGNTLKYDERFGNTTNTGSKTHFYDFDVDNFYLGATVGLGVSHHFNEGLELRVTPTFRMMTTLSGLDEKLKAYPYFMGVNAGIFLALNSKSPKSSSK